MSGSSRHPRAQQWSAVVGWLVVVGCGGGAGSAERAGSGPAPAPSGDCAAKSEFRAEHIALPPEFAPTMPAGDEQLLFAPGMFDPAHEEYWSYVFTMQFADGAVATSTPDLERVFLDYYRGLVGAVATSRGQSYPLDQVSVHITPGGIDGEQVARIQLFDAFTNGQPVALNLKLRRQGACLRASASPRPLTAPIWARLDAALACLPCGG